MKCLYKQGKWAVIISVRDISLVSFYEVSIGCLNYSDSVVFFILLTLYIVTWQQCIRKVNTKEVIKSRTTRRPTQTGSKIKATGSSMLKYRYSIRFDYVYRWSLFTDMCVWMKHFNHLSSIMYIDNSKYQLRCVMCSHLGIKPLIHFCKTNNYICAFWTYLAICSDI